MEYPDSEPFLYLPGFVNTIFRGTFTVEILVSILVILILLLISALVSGAEIAFFSLDPAHLKEIKGKETKTNKLILTLLEKPKRLLATILITNNFVNVGIVILSAFLISELFDFTLYPVIGFIIQVIVITATLLLFGEIMPKIYANQKQIIFASIMARPLKILVRVFYPLSTIMVKSTRIIDKKMAANNPEISMSELSDAIDITVTSGARKEETKILKGIVKFTDIEVTEIMRSRMDIVAVDSNTKFTRLIELVIEMGYSRMPVYNDTLDHVQGILYIKDLLPHLDKKDDFKWLGLLRPAFFIPENKMINDLLQEFQAKKIHLAIVVDEYGGTSGIVTFEDIIEEIVGEISDEFDLPEDELAFNKIDEHNYIFEGKTSINDFCKILGIDDKVFDEVKGDSDSLAGVLLEIYQNMPVKNTKIEFQNFEFTVLSVDKRRIKTIKVTLKPTEIRANEN